MLYVTTREKNDAYTAPRTLVSDGGSLGGLYLPFKMPFFSQEDIRALGSKSFGQNVADMLNLMFSAGLTAWDVEFCVGRHPVKAASMGQRVLVGELWRNLDGSYARMERRLADKLTGKTAAPITSWLRIAIRISVLFGLCGQLLKGDLWDGEQALDVAVEAGDFSLPMAVWYARKMGLPIAAVVCGCREESGAWDLLRMGEFRGGKAARELERLVYGTLGLQRAKDFADRGTLFKLTQEETQLLQEGMSASVVSGDRMLSVIPNVYRTNAYVLDTGAAYGYAALMDHRARTGEGRTALLLSDTRPADEGPVLADALSISLAQLKDLPGQA